MLSYVITKGKISSVVINEAIAIQAGSYLTANDPVLAPIIRQAGLCTIRPHRNYYQELVSSIISQQLSVKAAAAIEQRFVALYGGQFPAPRQILTKDIEQLRVIGFSRAKAAYVRDLAQHVLDGKVKFDHLDGLSNQAVISELTAVKGIGEWTAHMFLMFCMGRSDILPVGDLGIRNGITKLYKLPAPATADQIIAIAAANHWQPYQSIASWYVWQSLDNLPML